MSAYEDAVDLIEQTYFRGHKDTAREDADTVVYTLMRHPWLLLQLSVEALAQRDADRTIE